MRLLLVEDDTLLGDGIRAGLMLAAYAVDWVPDGKLALLALADHSYDACVLDLGLPGKDGLAVLREMRGRGDQTPVLLLTARDTAEDKIAGLDHGADDYLTKPFLEEEVVLRLRVLHRRTRQQPHPVLTVGPLHYDTHAHRFSLDGRPLVLTAQEQRILACLVHRAGSLVSRSEISEHVYARDLDPDSNTLDVLIGRIRRKLGVPLIHTERGLGYRLAFKPDGPDAR